MLKHTSTVPVLLMLLSAAVFAQDDKPIRVPRTPDDYKNVVSKYGEASPEVIPITVTSQRGVVATLPQNISDDVQKVRFHFSVRRPAATNTWKLFIVNSKGSTLWEHSPESDKFWSSEIVLTPSSRQLKIVVFSEEPVGPLDLVIDKVVKTLTVGEPQSIHGTNDLTPIARAPESIKDRGRSVARLLFISDVDGDQYVCTGFLVSPTLLLTNNHCIQSRSEMESAIAEFDYDIEDGPRESITFTRLIDTDPGLDFSLLRLRRSPTGTRPPLSFDISPLNEGRKLVIVQHPAGQAKQFSDLGCIISGVQRLGMTNSLTDFGHQCDTLGGSSGSFVLSDDKIVGLHHLGFRANDQILVNRAVNIKLVLERLRRLPEYGEIANAPHLP